jgi:hypothetical protein
MAVAQTDTVKNKAKDGRNPEALNDFGVFDFDEF